MPLQLAADDLRLTTAVPDQLNAAAAFLAKALARFPDGMGKAIGKRMSRRASRSGARQ